MKLVCFDEPQYYITETTTPAVRRLASLVGATVATPDKVELQTYADPSPDLTLVIHAAYLANQKIPVREVRARCPNATIVTLGSDCVHHLPGDEFDSPTEVDLHLDTMSEVVTAYRGRGIRADCWNWTASEAVLETIRTRFPPTHKCRDAACLINIVPGYAPQSYRHEMAAAFASAGVSCQFGGFSDDLGSLYGAVSGAWVNVGTTSPSFTKCRTMKGWRDWVAPHLGTVLIYDDHPDAVRAFGRVVPTYPYGDFPAAVELIRRLAADRQEHAFWLERQRQWVTANSIERQLLHQFKRHGILRRSWTDGVRSWFRRAS